MRFVLTGVAKIKGFHILRDDLIASAAAKGHHVDKRVYFGTDYLVTDLPDKMTIKRKTAKSLDVPVISTTEFIDMACGGEVELIKTLKLDVA